MGSDSETAETPQEPVSTEFEVPEKRFRRFVEAVAEVVPEARVRGSGDGLRVRAVAESNVVMVEAHCPASGILEPFEIGVRFDELQQAISDRWFEADLVRVDERTDLFRVHVGEGRSNSASTLDPDHIRKVHEIEGSALDRETEVVVPSWQFKTLAPLAEAARERSRTNGLVIETYAESESLHAFGTEDSVTGPIGGLDRELPAEATGNGMVYTTAAEMIAPLRGLPAVGDVRLQIEDGLVLSIEYDDWLTYHIAPRIQS